MRSTASGRHSEQRPAFQNSMGFTLKLCSCPFLIPSPLNLRNFIHSFIFSFFCLLEENSWTYWLNRISMLCCECVRKSKRRGSQKMHGIEKKRGNQFWNSGKNSTEKKSCNKSKARQRRVRDGSGICVLCHLSRSRSLIVFKRSCALKEKKKKRSSENTNGRELWRAQWCLFDQDASLGFRWDTSSKNRPSTLTFLVFEAHLQKRSAMGIFWFSYEPPPPKKNNVFIHHVTCLENKVTHF